MKRLLGMMVIVAVAGGMTGCFKGEEDTCEFWVEKLSKSAAIDRAMTKVGKLKCKAAIPILSQLYDEGNYQETILQTVKQIGDREGSVELLKVALRSTSQAKLAAAIVSEWKLEAARPELEKILSQDAYAQNREAALDALLSFTKPADVEDLLIQLAGYDANIQGILVNRKAIEALGEMRSKKAIPALVKMAYMRTNKGAEVYRDVRLALAQIGGAGPEVAKVLAGKAEGVREFTRTIGVQDWETRYGPKSVQMLGDTLDPTYVPALVQNMVDDLAPPIGVSDKALQMWQAGQRNRLKVIIFALGHIGAGSAVEGLTALVKDASKDTVNQRLNAAIALAMIGTTEAQKSLIEVWQAEKIEQFRRPLLQQVTLALDHTMLPEVEKAIGEDTDKVVKERDAFIEAVKELEAKAAAAPDDKEMAMRLAIANADRDAFQMTLDKNSAYLAVIRECQDIESCYLKRLKGDNYDEKVKALAVLARGKIGDPKRIVDALFEVFIAAEKNDVDAKRFALMGITRLGDKAAGERMLTLAEEIPDSALFWKDELIAFGHAVARRK